MLKPVLTSLALVAVPLAASAKPPADPNAPAGIQTTGIATVAAPVSTEIEQRAREAAPADARRRAGAIATASNVRLGDTLAVVESGGCQHAGPFGGAYALDTAALTMSVAVNETVTFAVAK